MAFQGLENQPRSSGTRAFLDEECAHAWSKALYVADRLKTIRPSEHDDLERYAAALFNCALAMGNNLEAVAVVNEINAWPKIQRSARQQPSAPVE
jgi:hypothetical protein